MGVQRNVGFSKFPRQGGWVGKRVEVVFEYDTANRIGGTFVRDDHEATFLAIIRLDDGRHVLSSECQHSHPE